MTVVLRSMRPQFLVLTLSSLSLGLATVPVEPAAVASADVWLATLAVTAVAVAQGRLPGVGRVAMLPPLLQLGSIAGIRRSAPDG